MRFASVCSGIEAASVAWNPLGWEAAWFSEIEKFPCEVLEHHYPSVPNFGDMLKIKKEAVYGAGKLDVLVGGTPCQSFSVAGLRGGLSDPRGNLALRFLQLADIARPRWLVWENVPGVLSSSGGRDFGSIIGGMAELGYGFAWRVLDAQYFGVPQRRRRVFVVGCLGNWRRAGAVLFERQSLCGNPPPSRTKGKGIAEDAAPCLRANGIGTSRTGTSRTGDSRGQDCVVATLDASFARLMGTSGQDINHGCSHLVTYAPSVSCALKSRDFKGPSSDGDGDGAPLIAHALRASGFDASEDGTGHGTPIIPILEAGKRCGVRGSSRDGLGVGSDGDPMFTLQAGAQHAVAFDLASITSPANGSRVQSGPSPSLAAPSQMHAVVHSVYMGSDPIYAEDVAMPSTCRNGDPGVIAFAQNQLGEVRLGEVANTLNTNSNASGRNTPMACVQMQVRRLTPRECERLQGFPDDYTAIPRGKRRKLASDAPRYRALGNSMAVPVMAWIGKRIQQVSQIEPEGRAG